MLKSFRLFVSSTFADFTAEREALRTRVLPHIRQLCVDLGARFELVDMRWGVSAEAADAQDAMQICLRELRRCLETGLRPSFLILLGDRYGSRMLPDEIAPSTFERIARQVGNRSGSRSEEELRRHYRLDENLLEPIYRLDFEQGTAITTRKRKARVEAIRRLLDIGAKNLPPAQLRQVDASATEREVEEGLLHADTNGGHAFCCIRELTGSGRRKAPWIDLKQGKKDRSSERRLAELRARVCAKLGKRAVNLRARLVKDTLDPAYLNKFCRIVYRALSDDIRAQAAVWEDETDLEQEVAAHRRFAADRSRDFTGRQEYREQIEKYLRQVRHQPLVISGETGIGKSALVAAAVRDFLKARPRARVVQRYMGATARSLSGDSFLFDLCREVQNCTGASAQAVSQNPHRLVDELRSTLAQNRRPLLLVIDALNQIPEGDIARDLRWLPADFQQNTRLIVSAVSSSFALQQLERKYPDCNEISLGGLTFEEGERLLALWLARAQRRLQPVQSTAILRAFRKHCSPLHLRLVANEAIRLRSTDPVYRPGKTVHAVIGSFIDRLSLDRSHGRLFVERSLAYIAASRYGLSHGEMQRVLWKDAEVCTEYRRRHRRSPRRTVTVAPLVWAQLYHDLSDYLTLRAGQGEELMTFFHDQVRDAVERRFLRKERTARHRQLAESFMPGRGESFAPRAYSELAYQLCHAAEWSHANALFGNAAFVAGSLRDLGTEPLIGDLDFALERGRHYLQDHVYIEALRRALAQSAHVLDRDRGEITAQLLGRLRAHDDPATRKLLRDLRASEVGAWIEPIGESLQNTGLLRILNLRNFDPAIETEPDTADDKTAARVWDLHLCSDQRTILTALHDGTIRVWDAVTGRMVAVLAGHEGGVESVCSTPDGLHAISAGHDGYVIVWDLRRRELVRRLKSPKAESAVAALPEGDRFISGSVDGHIRIWGLDGRRRPRTLGKGHKTLIWRIAVAKSGRIAVSTSQDGSARQWDLVTGKHRLVVRAGESSDLFRAAQLTDDGRYSISATGGGDVVTTCLASGRSTFSHVHPRVIRDLALTRSQRSVISVSQSGQLAISNIHSRRISTRIQAHGDEVNTVNLAGDGRTLYTGASDGVVKVWDLSVLRRSASRPVHRMGLVGVTVVKNGRNLISGDESGNVHVWDTHSGRHIRGIPIGHVRLRKLSATSDGQHLVFISSATFGDGYAANYGYDGSRLQVRDMRNQRGWSIDTNTPGRDSTFSLTPDDKHILAVTDEHDISLFSIESREPILRLRRVGYFVEQILVTPDSRRAVITSWVHEDYDRKRILVYDLKIGKRERVLVNDAQKFRSPVLRGRSQLLAGSENGKVRIWDLAAGKIIRSFPAHRGGVASIALKSDGRRLVTAGMDNRIKIWDAGRGTQLDTLGGEHELEHAGLSPGGRLCLCSTKDGSLRVWDVKYKRRLASFTANDRIDHWHVLADERTIIVAEVTGALHFLRLDVGRR